MSIIGDGIMLGAGGESASIFVTGLSETDSVSATHKVPNPEWKSLPDSYTQLKYIESTGTQYIQVPTPTVTNGFIVEFSFYSGSQPSGYYPLFVSLGSDGFWLGWLNGSFIVRMADNKNVITTSFTTNKWIDAKVVYDGSTVKLFFDGNQVGSATATFANGGVNTYFCYDTANKTSFRLGNFEFSVGGTVNYHYVPCKNGSGSVGLYDLVTNTFYGNAGTGTFVAGAEVPQYMDGYADGKTIAGKWTQKLNPAILVPDEYTQLEYLQSTGTQYIVTGLNSTIRYDHEITFSDYAYAKTQGILGSSNYYYSYTGYNNTLRWCMSDRCYDTPGSLTSKRTVKLGYNYLTVDGSSVPQTSDTNSKPSDTTHTLFKGYNCASVKIYSYRASLDGQLLRDFVPCKRNSDDELGMYDLVNDVFYTNSGTGEFVSGPEIPQTIDGFLIDKIKSYGTWFVVNADSTKSADVLIDAAAEFEVTL